MNLKVNFVYAISLTFALICFSGEEHDKCNHSHEHNHKHEHKHDDDVKAVFVTKALQQAMGLKTVHAESRRVESTISFAGRYELVPDARKVVSSPIAGRLSLIAKSLDNVKKGDVLFTVTSPELVARSHEISALEKRVKVYQDIKTPNAVLENELVVKRAERKSMLAGSEEKDGLVTVRAETDGMVEALLVQDGSWLETGTAVIQIVNRSDLRFKALVAQSDAKRLKDGMVAKVGENNGRIRVGVGDERGIVPVYVLFDDGVKAIAGELSHGECVSDEAMSAHMAVPSKCIVTIDLQPTVFIRDKHNEERFIAVAVTPGVSGGGWTAVDGLLTHHCELVSDGAYELKLAIPSAGKSKRAGHFHADGTFHEEE